MSIPMKLLVKALRLRPKPLASVETMLKDVAQDFTDAEVPRQLTRTHEVHEDHIEGIRVLTLTPRGAAPTVDLVYTHGGAYVHPMVTPHWAIVRRLVQDASARVTVPLYGLAPEHTAAQLPALYAIHEHVAERGLPLVVAGDSAGCALTMATILHARDEGGRLPDAALLFSPWVDATMTHPEIAAIEPHDPMLGSVGLVWSAEKWADGISLDDPRLSSLNDSLSGLPRLEVYQGGRDIFRPDAERFVQKAQSAGTKASFHLYPDAFHVFAGVPLLPEARDALTRAARVISEVSSGS